MDLHLIHLWASNFKLKKRRSPSMGNNRNTVYTRHMINNHPLSNKMHTPHLASRIMVQVMCHVVFPHNRGCVSDTDVKHIRARPCRRFVLLTPPIHPQTVVPLEEVDRSHICVRCSICNEVKIFFSWVMILKLFCNWTLSIVPISGDRD
jgi:hypothetical protein